MCGVVGFVAPRQPFSERSSILHAMLAALRHRGPDEFGFYVDPLAALACARLNVIDPRGGRQPMSDREGRHWITYNGEIYNYIELRKELVDLGQIGLDYPQTCIAVSQSYMQRQRDDVRNYIKITIEAVHLMYTNKELAMKVFGKYTKTDDRGILEAAYHTYLDKTDKVPYVKPTAVKLAIDLLAEQDPKFRSARPEDFIDNSIVKEIEDSGFVNELYGKKM